MAAVSGDYFTIGSTVWCRTCYNQEIEGEVLAFDPQSKMLSLKCPSSSGITQLNDVHFINLSLVSELNVKKEVTTLPEIPLSLNLQKINQRIKLQVDAKRKLLTTMSSSVTPEGQRLFLAIAKTIKEVRWRDNDIVVFDDVVISPPYQLDNMKGSASSKEYTYIRKLVEKHMKDTLALNSPVNQAQAVQHTQLQ